MTFSQTRRAGIAAACAAVLGCYVVLGPGLSMAVALTASTFSTAAVPGAAPDTYYVSPAGKGVSCTSTAPCGTFADAVSKATKAGSIVSVAAGRYGPQTIPFTSVTESFPSNVVVKPAAGAQVTVDGVNIVAPHVTVQSMTSTGTIYLKPGAHHSGFNAMTTVAASAYISSADYAFIRNSKIRPAIDNDAMQIKTWGAPDPVGVVVESNLLGPTQRGPAKAHVDCLQIMGGNNLRIRYNVMYQCASQGIIAGDGASGRVGSGSVIERNLIQLCPVRTSSCDGYDAVNVTMPGLVFAQNTVIDGNAKIVGALAVVGNYFDALQTCSGFVASNMWGKTNNCKAATAALRNTKGTPVFINRTASPPDLHLRSGSVGTALGIDWAGLLSSVDIDGQAVSKATSDRGADQVSGSPLLAQPAGSIDSPAAAPAAAAATPSATATPSVPASPTVPTPAPSTAAPAPVASPRPGSLIRTSVFTGRLNSQHTAESTPITTVGGSFRVHVALDLNDGVDDGKLRVTVTDRSGKRVAWANENTSATVELSLPSGTYDVTIGSRPATYIATVTYVSAR